MNPVYVKADFAGLREAVEAFVPSRIFIVCDSAVSKIAARVGIDAPILELSVNEENKSLRTVEKICAWLLEGGADRKSFVLSVGGGIVSDMVGFAASIYMRGIRFAYVPTTLLAMCDAAIGGKTGVNFSNLKNILGTFTEPCFTWMAACSLVGLPRRDVLSGAAEMFKSFIICNEGGEYSRAIAAFSNNILPDDCDESSAAWLLPLASAAASVKAGIVTRDFRESGERKLLNLAHTFAHAIEFRSREDGSGISHGEAVSMGLVLAARLSEKLSSGAPKGFADSLAADLSDAGLMIDCPYRPSLLAEPMRHDKKGDCGEVSFVLMHGIGNLFVSKLDPVAAMALIDNQD